MTGYGTGKASRDGWEVTVELKTVNHRFLDLGLRLPRNIAFLEQTVREKVTAGLKRGHVDVFISVNRTDAAGGEVEADPALAAAYHDAAERIAKAVGKRNDVTVRDLLKMDGVVRLTETQMDETIIASLCGEATGDALTQVTDMRQTEGEALRADLSAHIDAAEILRGRILERAPGVVRDYRNKLKNRMDALLSEGADPQRLAQEVALMADRCAIDEELQRLESHISQMRGYLNAGGEIGKKMDFLIQEMNREANTIGSKASDAEIAQYVVDLKSEIEKLREQIQNVE